MTFANDIWSTSTKISKSSPIVKYSTVKNIFKIKKNQKKHTSEDDCSRSPSPVNILQTGFVSL